MAARRKKLPPLPPIKDGRNKYGLNWGDEWTDTMIELWCFRHDRSVAQGGLGKAEHFWNVCSHLWGPNSRKQFIRNPWGEKMIEEACRWQYLSVSGPASASKSDTFAVWALVNWISDPINTAVLVTSTSLSASRKRIWGSISDYFMAVPDLPGKLVDSIGIIRFEDPVTGQKASDRSAISLISGEKKNEKEAIGKLVGIKNQRVLLIGDELPELSPALVHAATSNLSSNPEFQFVGLGNPNSIFDPHGVLSTPKKGWKSFSLNDEEWETELGYAIRFDGEKSPNILAGEVLYPFLPKKEWIEDQKKNLGENSPGYFRMVRGAWCPEGSAFGIYTENDIATYGGEERHVSWVGAPTPCAALDPDFSNDGDGSHVQFGLFGECSDGYPVLLFTEDELLTEDTNSKEPRNVQIAKKYMAACKKRGVLPNNAGYDCTGAGNPFGDILAELWSPEIHRVQFGGSATDLPVGQVGSLPASRRYLDRVSELWFCGLDFLRSGQLKGINADLARDLTGRRGGQQKRGDYNLQFAESKKEMRKRTGKSPNHGDSAMILLDLCRTKHRFRANTQKVFSKQQQKKWGAFVAKNERPERELTVHLPRTREVRSNELVRFDGGDGWGTVSLM